MWHTYSTLSSSVRKADSRLLSVIATRFNMGGRSTCGIAEETGRSTGLFTWSQEITGGQDRTRTYGLHDVNVAL
jgi:hypothetical protein